MSALVAPSGACLRDEGLVWLIGAVVCSLAAAAGPIERQRVQWIAALALQHHWLLPITIGSCQSTATSDDCKARLVRFPCKMRYISIPGFSLSFLQRVRIARNADRCTS